MTDAYAEPVERILEIVELWKEVAVAALHVLELF